MLIKHSPTNLLLQKAKDEEEEMARKIAKQAREDNEEREYIMIDTGTPNPEENGSKENEDREESPTETNEHNTVRRSSYCTIQ